MIQDEFGIKKIYADSQRHTKAPDWYMGRGNYQDRIKKDKWLEDNQGQFITDSQNNVIYKRNPNTNKQVRMNVFATTDPKEEELGGNRFTIVRKKDSESDPSSKGGYLFKPQDWRDLEVSCYIYVDDDDADDNYAWFVRGGYQGSNDFQDCSSCKYSASLYYSNGNFRPSKKTSHGRDHHRDSNDPKVTIFDGPIGDTRGKWIGYKAIVYNLPPAGSYPQSENTPVFPVKIELWIDRVDNENDPNGNFVPRNQWVKKMETMDNPLDNHYGEWGPNQNKCGAPRFVTLSWGGPMVTFRIDKNGNNDPLNNFRLKFASIREIEPGLQNPDDA
jgi:hypothetical protein